MSKYMRKSAEIGGAPVGGLVERSMFKGSWPRRSAAIFVGCYWHQIWGRGQGQVKSLVDVDVDVVDVRYLGNGNSSLFLRAINEVWLILE